MNATILKKIFLLVLMAAFCSGGSAKPTKNTFAECVSCSNIGGNKTSSWGNLGRRACWVAAAPASMGFNATTFCGGGGGGGCVLDPLLGPGAVGACNWTLGVPKPL